MSNCFGAAAFHGQLNTLMWIASHNANVDIEFKVEEKPPTEGMSLRKEITGYTPLMLAIMAGDKNIAVVKYLIDTLKCNVRARDVYGNTVVHVAVRCGCEETVRYLLREKRVEAFERNSEGKTAVAIARERGMASVEGIFAQVDGSAAKVCVCASEVD